jgi:hypothetical protein
MGKGAESTAAHKLRRPAASVNILESKTKNRPTSRSNKEPTDVAVQRTDQRTDQKKEPTDVAVKAKTGPGKPSDVARWRPPAAGAYPPESARDVRGNT